MAKSRQRKEEEVRQLAEKLRRMKVAVFSSTSGLKVKDATGLRTILRAAGVEYIVVKKTLLRRALDASNFGDIDVAGIREGFGLALGYDDEVTPAKLLGQFSKTHESMKFIAGILGGRRLDAREVEALSRLPSHDQLRRQLVGTIAAPLYGLVNVLVGNLRGLVRVIDAVRERRATAPAL